MIKIMGATNEIKGTNIGSQLLNKNCPQCFQSFTKEDIDKRNFDIWWDDSGDVELESMKYKGWYKFSIIIRSIEHKECSEITKDYE